MSYIQMHIGNTKRHRGNIVRLVHEATPTRGGSPSYSILLVTAMARALKGAAVTEVSTKLGPCGSDSQSRRLCRGMVWSISCSNGLVKPRAPRYTPNQSSCSVTLRGVRYS